MAKVFIEETTLSAIGDAIRTKTETTELINPADMAEKIEGITTGGNTAELTITSNGTYTAPEGIDGYTPITVNVPQDGSPPAEALVISGSCRYRFSYNYWNWFIEQYGSQIITENIDDATFIFTDSSNLYTIPFEINCNSSKSLSFPSAFLNCRNLIEVPKINGAAPMDMNNMFSDCRSLREIPEDFESWFDWSKMENSTSAYAGGMEDMFEGCRSLRKIPVEIFAHAIPVSAYSKTYFSGLGNACYVLDELVDLPVPYTAIYTSNIFRYIQNASRLKRFTFKTPDGVPYIKNWKSQLLDLSDDIGYGNSSYYIGYSNIHGITEATEIIDDATYQALKNNEDSWTDDVNYSRYNKTSAVETINSLPDTSAYLATAGGTNTIKFKGAAGALTDGGAINTMTEEEIAVATAKGWTVSFV